MHQTALGAVESSMASSAEPVSSDSAAMADVQETSTSPSPPPLLPTSPHPQTASTTQPSPPNPTPSPTPLPPTPDTTQVPSVRFGRVKVGPTSALPRPAADEAAAAPHLRYLVMALGSSTLRYGTAEEFQPRSKAMAVAYRRKGADGRKRRRAQGKQEESKEERRNSGTAAMHDGKETAGDVPMKEERKDAQHSRASSAVEAGVAAQIAAWHEQSGEDFTVLNAEVIKRRVQPVRMASLTGATRRMCSITSSGAVATSRIAHVSPSVCWYCLIASQA